jgi:hypothetical protein
LRSPGATTRGLLLAEIDSRAQVKLGRPLTKDWIERYERDRAVVFDRVE